MGVITTGSSIFVGDLSNNLVRKITCSTGFVLSNGNCTQITFVPTQQPTLQPTKLPTQQPTQLPTQQPTSSPTSAVQYISNMQTTLYTGTKNYPGHDDGSIVIATFSGPHGLCYDPNSQSLYCIDFDTALIRKINLLTETVSTIATGT